MIRGMKKSKNVDYHVHSQWSPDSRMPIKEALDYCAQQEIHEVAFTEHMDIGIQHKKAYHRLDEYLQEVATLKLQYPELHILSGIEAGVNVGNLEATEQLLQNLPLDYIIFSLHASHRYPFCSKKAYTRIGHAEFLQLYFDEMLHIVSQGKKYHALGHMDYILRYHPYTIEEFLSYENQIKEILKQLKIHNAALEVNTKGIQSLHRPHPPIEILRWYAQLGGELVVIGSDAHAMDQIGEHFNYAKEWIRTAGLMGYHTFEKGDWVKNPL